MAQNINCFYQNVRGLNTKTNEFYNNTLLLEYDLIAISETWLQSNVHDSEIINNNYVLFRADRKLVECNKSRGGGTMLAVKHCFSASSVQINLENSFIDVLCVKINLNFKQLFVFVVYIPPSASNESYSELLNTIQEICLLNDSNALILGDINISELNNFYRNGVRSTLTDIFEDFLSITDMSQINRIENINNRILDVIVSNIQCNVEKTEGIVNEDSHHPPLSIELLIPKKNFKQISPSKDPSYNFRRANFDLLYLEFVSQDWSTLYSTEDIDKAFDLFYTTIYDIFDRTVPKTCRTNKYPPWFNRDIKNLIKEKEKLRKLYQKNKNEAYHERFKQCRGKLKKKIKIEFKHYLEEAENNLKSNPNTFWSYINSKKRCSRLPANMKYNDSEISNGTDIAEAFANNFKKVYSNDSNINVNSINSEINNAGISNLLSVLGVPTICEQDVATAIKKLKSKAAPGPDGVPAYIVKGCSDVLVRPLCYLFNLSLQMCNFPSVLKSAKICPLYKTGDKSNVENYRPISILSCISKVFESIIYKYIYDHVKVSITQHQHGFVSKKSTTTNLLNFIEYTHEAFSESSQVDVVYTDFQKAFDKVSHKIIINKLSRQYNFSVEFCKFLNSYLLHRKQAVFYNGYKSSTYISTSGVPQGSNLGPLLFIMFINDITTVIMYSKILLFADDAKIFLNIKSQEYCKKIQSDIDEIYSWSKKNFLPFNVSKCSIMSYSYKKNENIIYFDYKMDNTSLKRIDNVKDLGITMDTKLKFESHIENVKKETFKKTGFIIRNCKEFKNMYTYINLFNTLIRPKTEYVCVIWDPFYNKYNLDIEKVQRNFYKYANYYINGSIQYDYNMFLSSNKLLKLEHRRDFLKLCHLYKIVNFLVDDSITLERINISVPVLKTRMYKTFHEKICTTNYLKYSPIHSMIILFNRYQMFLDIFSDTFKTYKYAVKRCLLSIT